jgi:Tfp pilus assembly protein FimT
MVLVMALVTIIAGLAVPSLGGMYGYYKMTAAVDSVRAAWALARTRAVEEGRPYRFAVMLSKGSYRLAPDRPAYWGGQPPGADPEGPGVVRQGTLPEGVAFGGGGGGASGAWSDAVVFLPDGTAREDVDVVFQVRGARATLLHLRAMTGVVTVKPYTGGPR